MWPGISKRKVGLFFIEGLHPVMANRQVFLFDRNSRASWSIAAEN